MAKALSYYEKFLSRKAVSTRREYLRYFNRFLASAELTPEGLYEMHKTALKSVDIRESDVIGGLLGEYLDKMKEEGYSNSTMNMTTKSVRSFFTANKLHFDISQLSRRRISNGVQRIGIDDIRELYSYGMGRRETKARNRALYLLLLNAGIRVSDASALTVKQYREARDEEISGVRFKVFAPFPNKKTGDLIHMILGEEAIADIDKYLGDRQTGFLFQSFTGGQWRAQTITIHFIEARKVALKNRVRVSAHSFRKSHRTLLEGAGMPESWVKLLEGKKSDVYSRPQDDDTLLLKYAECYDALRIRPHAKLGEEVEGIRAEMVTLKAEKLEQNGEVARLRGGIEQVLEINRKVIEGLREAQEMKAKEDKIAKKEMDELREEIRKLKAGQG